MYAPTSFYLYLFVFFKLNYKFYHVKFQMLYSVTINPLCQGDLVPCLREFNVHYQFNFSISGTESFTQLIVVFLSLSNSFIQIVVCAPYSLTSHVLRILVYYLHIEGHYGQSFYFSHASADIAPYTLLFHAAGKTFNSDTHRLFTFLCLDVQRTFFSYGVQQYHQFEL